MRLWVSIALVAGSLAGCQAAPSVSVPAERSVTVNVAAMRQVLAEAHRWVDADIYEYRVQLQVEVPASGGTAAHWDNVGAAAVLPRVGTPKSSVTFSRLAPATHYQAIVKAYGNKGATAAQYDLSAATACIQDFNFAALANDQARTLSATARIVFDKVAFSGTLRFTPASAPLNTARYDIYRIVDGGAPVLLAADRVLTAGQGVVIQNVGFGTAYQVRFDAKNAAGTILHSVTSGAQSFSATGQNLEQDVTVSVPFSKPPALAGTIQ